jgi:hypothetical protein
MESPKAEKVRKSGRRNLEDIYTLIAGRTGSSKVGKTLNLEGIYIRNIGRKDI